MFWLGHLAAGYLVTLAFISFAKFHFTAEQIHTLIVLGTFFGTIPDFDIFVYFLKNKSFKVGTKNNTHRDYFTHAPLVWLIIGLGICFASTDHFWKTIGILLWLCSWTHFAIDTIEFGIMWTWPFSKRRFMLKEVPDENPKTNRTREYYRTFFRNSYSKTLTFYLEVLIVFAAIVIAILR